MSDNKYFTKFISESDYEFQNRLLFIKKLENNNIDIKEAIRLSKIWYCIKYKKCKYPNEIYTNIMSLDK